MLATPSVDDSDEIDASSERARRGLDRAPRVKPAPTGRGGRGGRGGTRRPQEGRRGMIGAAAGAGVGARSLGALAGCAGQGHRAWPHADTLSGAAKINRRTALACSALSAGLGERAPMAAEAGTPSEHGKAASQPARVARPQPSIQRHQRLARGFGGRAAQPILRPALQAPRVPLLPAQKVHTIALCDAFPANLE